MNVVYKNFHYSSASSSVTLLAGTSHNYNFSYTFDAWSRVKLSDVLRCIAAGLLQDYGDTVVVKKRLVASLLGLNNQLSQ